MSGIGKRFIDAGYDVPKPLIIVQGKPIIEHVVSMFKGNHEFVFICNQEHLENTNMSDVLRSIKPDGKIISIPPHKEGPVYAVTYAYGDIDDNEDVIISYCDYYMEWDFNDMIRKIKEGKYDGAVPSYTGFHPHLLHKKLYGGVLVDENSKMIDYKEKHSFTDDPMNSFHSAGAYYFRTGKELKQYSDELLKSDIHINGEKYTSMVYYLYLRDKKNILVPNVRRFMQWGTPEDLEEFIDWETYFNFLKDKNEQKISSTFMSGTTTKIPYAPESEEFKKCYTYWESYFIR